MKPVTALIIAFGTLGVVGCATYPLAAVVAEVEFGRPNSTEAIGFLIAVVLAVAGGIGGSILGLLCGFGCSWLVPGFVIPTRRFWMGLLIASALLVSIISVLAIFSVKTKEAWNAPHIVKNLLALSEMDHALTMCRTRREAMPTCQPTYISNTSVPLNWNKQTLKFNCKNGIDIQGADGSTFFKDSLKGYDYVGSAVALPVFSDRYLAVLLELRATGHRSIFLILDPSGQTVYQEVVERYRGITSNLAECTLDSGSVAVVVNTGSVKTYALSP